VLYSVAGIGDLRTRSVTAGTDIAMSLARTELFPQTVKAPKFQHAVSCLKVISDNDALIGSGLPWARKRRRILNTEARCGGRPREKNLAVLPGNGQWGENGGRGHFKAQGIINGRAFRIIRRGSGCEVFPRGEGNGSHGREWRAVGRMV
jgi:hypothetical protein